MRGVHKVFIYGYFYLGLLYLGLLYIGSAAWPAAHALAARNTGVWQQWLGGNYHR
jgi:hypothetical protein